ncbi:Putrescine importer PuuP [compost metagenome]
MAEETPNPSKRIPKAMRMTIYIGGAAAMFAALALILAVPDIAKVISGDDKDPMYTIMVNAFGPTGWQLVTAVITVSFVSCVLSLQAAASRLLYSFARDEMVMGSGVLKRLSPNTRVPTAALITCGVIPAAIVCAGFFLENAIAIIVSFAAIGIYLSFQMIVGGALFARLRGWKPAGQFTLGAWGWLVNILALVYGLLAVANMSWPRTPDAPWYSNYGILLTAGVVIAIGLFYMAVFKPYDKGTAPFADAWKLHKK